MKLKELLPLVMNGQSCIICGNGMPTIHHVMPVKSPDDQTLWLTKAMDMPVKKISAYADGTLNIVVGEKD